MYFAMSSICCRPRISIAFVSNALIDSETSCRLSARFVAVTMTSSRPVTVGGAACASCADAAPEATESTAEMAAESACGPGRVASRVASVMSFPPQSSGY